jgi:phosphoribosylformylglycinamidine synthase
MGAPVLHDISTGGLAVALSEICIASAVGAEIHNDDWRKLFSEDPHRFLVVAPTGLGVRDIADEEGLPIQQLGTMGGEVIRLGRAQVSLAAASTAFENALRGQS